ncbi:hypothetical protein Tsubulata_029648, partial [Turnera subulata]
MPATTWRDTLYLFYILVVIFPFFASASDSMTTKDMNLDKVFCTKFTVHVTNAFTNDDQPLLLHCWSRDQDLGNHTLYSGGDFSFHFQQRFLPPATHFTCDMKWG